MSENSKIEWTDHTFNPWEGCAKVSPGCANCYAEARDKRFTGGIHWGKGAKRRLTSGANWKLPLKWNKKAAESGVRPRVFCASLADWLDDEVPTEWRARLLSLILMTPHLDWLLLTKRPHHFDDALNAIVISAIGSADESLYNFAGEWRRGRNIPSNVWIGTTVEDQTRANERIPQLLAIPARVRFLSCEPLLEKVDIRPRGTYKKNGRDVPLIDWVIAGGESGPGARPMHPDWARGLRDQCAAAGVPFHFKQWGEWIARSQVATSGVLLGTAFRLKSKDTAVMRRDSGIDKTMGWEMATNDADSAIFRVGKHAAGRLLDGVEHNGFPAMTPTAIITRTTNPRGHCLFHVNTMDGRVRVFHTAQDAADWIETEMPGAVVEWRVG